MPRTKLPRNGGGNKRQRDNNAELEEILRDFEIEGKKIKILRNSVEIQLTLFMTDSL